MPNEATTFREAVAENLRDVFLGQGHAEEQAEWRRKGEAPRTITIRVLRQRREEEDSSHKRSLLDVIEVLCTRHAGDGIVNPGSEDYLFRTEIDAQRPWRFRSILKADSSGDGQVLEFTSRIPQGIGQGERSPL